MRFALYHPWVYLTGGIERVLSEIVGRSAHEWTIYTHHYDAASTFPALDGAVVSLAPRVSVRRSLGPLVAACATVAATRLPEDGAQALLVSSESVGDLILARARIPAVCFCHTPLKILHDPESAALLAETAPRKAQAVSLLGPSFTHVQRRLFRRYRHVFSPSRETANRLSAARLAGMGPTEVLHPGVDIDRFGPDDQARDPFFLIPGRIMWEKGIDLAIDGFEAARRRGLTSRLVVAGAVDEKSREYFGRLGTRSSDLPVEFEVNPTDARLAELYRRGVAVLFPPANEDFGIVPLEAMASGTPVIAMDRGGPRESIIHGETGWLVEPTVGGIADRLLEAEALQAADGMAAMRRAARNRATEFGWGRFVDRVDEVMTAVATGAAVPVSSGRR